MLRFSESVSVNQARLVLADHGFALDSLVFRGGEWVMVAVVESAPPVLGVEGCGPTIEDAAWACVDHWAYWRSRHAS